MDFKLTVIDSDIRHSSFLSRTLIAVAAVAAAVAAALRLGIVGWHDKKMIHKLSTLD